MFYHISTFRGFHTQRRGLHKGMETRRCNHGGHLKVSLQRYFTCSCFKICLYFFLFFPSNPLSWICTGLSDSFLTKTMWWTWWCVTCETKVLRCFLCFLSGITHSKETRWCVIRTFKKSRGTGYVSGNWGLMSKASKGCLPAAVWLLTSC